MDKLRELSASLKADADALRRDGVYGCCVGTYEYAAAKIDAILRESEEQQVDVRAVEAKAWLPDAKAEAKAWLLDVMGTWDFTMPTGAFIKIVNRIAASATPRTEPTEAQVDAEAIERVAALLYEGETGDPWTVAGVEQPGVDRAYYREWARKIVAAIAASATPRTDPEAVREAVRGSTLRFGLGAWIVNTGTYAGEPCVFIDDAPTWGKVGERAPDVPQGVKPFIRLLFPTAEQATAVQLALTTPPAGDGACELYAHLLDMLGAKDHEHAARIIAQHHARELGDAARVTDGVALIAAERRRQMDVEGWTPEHDDEHAWGELALAAVCYAMPEPGRGHPFPRWWPWDASWWKPSDRIRELVKAGALIAAEIERLQRAAAARERGAP